MIKSRLVIQFDVFTFHEYSAVIISLGQEIMSGVGGGRGEGGKWEFLEGEKRERKYERLTFLIQQCVRISKTRTQNVFDLHLTSSQLPLRLLSK